MIHQSGQQKRLYVFCRTFVRTPSLFCSLSPSLKLESLHWQHFKAGFYNVKLIRILTSYATGGAHILHGK